MKRIPGKKCHTFFTVCFILSVFLLFAGPGCRAVTEVRYAADETLYEYGFGRTDTGLLRRAGMVVQGPAGDVSGNEELILRAWPFFEKVLEESVAGCDVLEVDKRWEIRDASVSSPVDLLLADSFVLASEARQRGLQDIAFFWYSGLDSSLDDKLVVIISAAVIDTVTGARIYSTNHRVPIKTRTWYGRSIKIGSAEFENLVSEYLADAAKEMAGMLCEAAQNQVWSASIFPDGDMRVRIAAGKKQGLLPGMVFDVHKLGEVVESVNNQRFRLIGERVAGLIVESVDEFSATGRIIDGENVRNEAVILKESAIP